MKNKIKSAVKRYYKKAKKADYISAEIFAEQLGYPVILFNTSDGDEVLRSCRCTANHKAFTYNGSAKYIFIDGNIPCESRLYLLLHEIGHILLGHIGDGKSYTRNSILIDVEANAFVNDVLSYKKFNILPALCAVIIFVTGVGIGLAFPLITESPSSEPANIQTTDISDNQSDIVYITRTGTKYHRADCRYTKDKDCTAVSRQEVQGKYTPCSYCRP